MTTTSPELFRIEAKVQLTNEYLKPMDFKGKQPTAEQLPAYYF